MGNLAVHGEGGNEVIFDNRSDIDTVVFVARLDAGELIELATLTVADGGGHFEPDERVFDDDACSVRTIEARTLDGEVLETYPVGTCDAIVLE